VSDTIPSDGHVAGDSGHVTDHNNMADMLQLLTKEAARRYGTVSAADATNVAAVENVVTLGGSYKTLVVLYPSGDTTGATDTAAINAAITNAAPRTRVHLAGGLWYVNAPIVVNEVIHLSGDGAGMNGAGATTPPGTVLYPTTTWANSGQPHPAVISLNNGGTLQSPIITGIAIDNSDSQLPADVDGIALCNDTNGTTMENISIGWVTGYGISSWSTSTAGWYRNIMIQRPGKHGWFNLGSDNTIICSHIQYAGNVDPTQGDGFHFDTGNGGNLFLIGCRSDLCFQRGFYIDVSGTYGDAVKLVGCGTERNQQHGVMCDNSSTTGQDWRTPVYLTGCSIEGDGTAGTSGGNYGGVGLRGRVRCIISGGIIAVATTDVTAGAPKYAVYTNSRGTGPGQPIELLMSGVRLNYSTGQSGAWCNDTTLVDNLCIDRSVIIVPGYESTTVRRRYGSATLVGGTVTVTSEWATATSRILLSRQGTGGTLGHLSVGTRSAGSFVINSSGAETSTIHWEIIGE
jgi:hypothetical protein